MSRLATLAPAKSRRGRAVTANRPSRRTGKPGRIRVGTASWTDPGFIADWYPRGLSAGERLA